MDEEIAILIAKLLIQYGPDVAAAFAKMFKGGATIDEAISALDAASCAGLVLELIRDNDPELVVDGASLARDISGLLGDEADIARLGQMV